VHSLSSQPTKGSTGRTTKATTLPGSGNNSEEEECYSKLMMQNLKEKLSMNDVASHAKFKKKKKWPQILDSIDRI
jgi:hypothetical protein